MKRILLALGMLAAASAPALACPHRRYDLVLPAVEIRPGVRMNLHATVFIRAGQPCNGSLGFAIHGMLHTAATWDRMADELFDHKPAPWEPCGLVALDMPGHGGSVLPASIWLGSLTLQDYVSAIVGALDKLRELHIHPDTWFAHSLGGLTTQMVQQRLISQGTNLRKAYGIRDVVLLASATPQQVPCYAIDSGMLSQIVMNFAQIDPAAGSISISDTVWSWMFFAPDPTNPLLVVPGAPTPAEVNARHYNAAETIGVVAALSSRPGVDKGIFAPAHGTALTLVTYEADVVIRPQESQALYTYLTGDTGDTRFVLVHGWNAIHDTHISNPALLIDSLRALVRFP